MKNWLFAVAICLVLLGLLALAQPAVLTVDLGGGVKMEFIPVRPGSFKQTRIDYQGNLSDPSLVTLTRGFYLGKYEVTQAQWESVMGNNPNYSKGPQIPVAQVSWDACQEFLAKLGKLAKGYTARLPTQAEWLYANRAGADADVPPQATLGDYAWYDGNRAREPLLVVFEATGLGETSYPADALSWDVLYRLAGLRSFQVHVAAGDSPPELARRHRELGTFSAPELVSTDPLDPVVAPVLRVASSWDSMSYTSLGIPRAEWRCALDVSLTIGSGAPMILRRPAPEWKASFDAMRGTPAGDSRNAACDMALELVRQLPPGFVIRPVGLKQPNAWGFHDMLGNVEEWCADWYDDGYPPAQQLNPRGPTSGKWRVVIGGSVYWEAKRFYPAPRPLRWNLYSGMLPASNSSGLGFRVVVEAAAGAARR